MKRLVAFSGLAVAMAPAALAGAEVKPRVRPASMPARSLSKVSSSRPQYPHLVRDYYQAIKGISAGAFLNGTCLGEWTNTAPTLYVWMKVLWNPDLDVDAVLDEMCERLYGKAGNTARELMKLECDVWEKGEWTKDRIKQPGGWPVPRRLFPVVFTPDVVQRMESLRNKALAETADHYKKGS